VKAVADWGMGCILIETDYANMVQAVHTKDLNLAPEGVIFRDIRSIVQLNFSSFVIYYCPHGCNKIAQALEVFGANHDDYLQVWLESGPEHVRVLVASVLTEPILI
jgi:hypothetical protein